MLQRCTVRSVTLAYDWAQAAEPQRNELIVFIHGVGADHTGWEPQVAFFAGHGFDVAAIDMRGSGDSQARDESGRAVPISISEFALDVDALIRALGYERAHWVGNSMGGVIIMEGCRLGLRSMASIALCNTFACHPESAAILPRPGTALKTRSLEQFARERIPAAHRPSQSAEILERSIAAMARKDVECYLASWRETWSQDYRPILSAIAVPALVVTGSEDPLTPPALGEEIARGIPGARLVELAHAGHLSNVDQPEQYNEQVLAFLNSHRA